MTPAQAQERIEQAADGPMVAEAAHAAPGYAPPAVREALAGLSETELLRRAVRGLSRGYSAKTPRWCAVMDTLGLTSAGAVALCNRLNLNPNERMGF